MITRIKRPPRRIFLNGKQLTGGKKQPPQSEKSGAKSKASSNRRSIITPDGRMNEVAAADYLGRSVSTLQNWRSMGQLPQYLKEHGRVFYRQADLDDFRRG